MPSATKIRQLTFSALLAALGACVQVIEGYIPSAIPLPGGRLGLSNAVTMVVLKIFGFKYAIAVGTAKSLIAVLISGRVSALPYSLIGSLTAVIAMKLADRYIKNIGGVGCGIIGAWSNNIAQTAVGAAIMSNIHILSYIWVLGPVSIVTGAFTGIISDYVGRKIAKWRKN